MIHGITVQSRLLDRYGLTTPQENITVHLTSQGIYVKDEDGQDVPVAYDDFGMVLSQMIIVSPTKSVFLRVNRDIPHGQTVWVLDIAKQNGAADLSLLETGR